MFAKLYISTTVYIYFYHSCIVLDLYLVASLESRVLTAVHSQDRNVLFSQYFQGVLHTLRS